MNECEICLDNFQNVKMSLTIPLNLYSFIVDNKNDVGSLFSTRKPNELERLVNKSLLIVSFQRVLRLERCAFKCSHAKCIERTFVSMWDFGMPLAVLWSGKFFYWLRVHH